MNWWIVFWIVAGISLIAFVIIMCITAAGAEQDRLQDDIDKLSGGQ